jgi:hypothetical protein
MKLPQAVLPFLGLLPICCLADPTWPSSVDELEDIMFLNTGYRSRGFAVGVTPCSFSATGPGRIAAAEWLRTAFHDMITGNVYLDTGGLDASLLFETDREENIGDAFNTTFTFLGNFYNSRATASDLLALSVYTATRSCGGPIVPIRAGRIDATEAGDIGVPEPQDPTETFENQFLRVGFNSSDMIISTACGHTLGGVHAEDFPTIVLDGLTPNNLALFDETGDVFDNKVVVDYLADNTTNPLVVGNSVDNGRNSDGRVYAVDGNVTMQTLADPEYFAAACASIFQRMIEVVPPAVTLTDPIEPYEVKPTALQLTLLSGGDNITFSGEIRVRTTVRSADSIASVQLSYKDRSGTSCWGCTIEASQSGTANGFDDEFAVSSKISCA